jgi:hypothetical protein
MRSIANQRTAAQAPVMNDCRITPSAYPTYGHVAHGSRNDEWFDVVSI